MSEPWSESAGYLIAPIRDEHGELSFFFPDSPECAQVIVAEASVAYRRTGNPRSRLARRALLRSERDRFVARVARPERARSKPGQLERDPPRSRALQSDLRRRLRDPGARAILDHARDPMDRRRHRRDDSRPLPGAGRQRERDRGVPRDRTGAISHDWPRRLSDSRLRASARSRALSRAPLTPGCCRAHPPRRGPSSRPALLSPPYRA